ncbi:ribonuclease H family protein [Clostridium sp. AL.422]|uniref:ribonuclease H family protein n=1 Tax=Clostridium TaxID=1485 RepID=UPI00293DABF9|nr:MULTISPECIES: ribonuclease H family protein [unclassified Clostridium]MDV4149845.1 ribonuclease H family protein [Clostridium sp. AL.422]
MAKKVYAIKEGFNFATNEKVENLIVDTWAECQRYIKGVKGAKYKSFEDINDAKAFLSQGDGMLKKGVDRYPMDCLHIYVDGSYNVTTERYAYALVAVKDNVIEYVENGKSEDSSSKSIRQIAGELEATVKGVEYALRQNEKKVVIFHDYAGIAHHATGFWERKEQSSIDYHNKMKSLIDNGIEVIFVKVDSHTGDLYNEIADEKCKEALNIDSNYEFYKYLRDNKIYVSNNLVKEQLKNIARDREDNIISINEESNVVLQSIDNEEALNTNNDENNEIINKLNDIFKNLSKEKQKDVLSYAEYLLNKENKNNNN